MPTSRVLLALVLGSFVLAAPPAQADSHNHFGESGRDVAREIGCRHFRGNGGGEFNLDSGVCQLRGYRVNVITFRSRGQQSDWNSVAHLGLPSSHWWANGDGAVVTARNGNIAAARVGARLLPGRLKRG